MPRGGRHGATRAVYRWGRGSHARELAPVRVNGVTPGLIDIPLLHTAYGAGRDAIVQNRAAILPGTSVGAADEVAQVILMLMTNDYVTGEVVQVDGGSRFV
jgi:NAD(P)-dependent dehydrogenase (short-subunit alcohol dehydrogenase family)